jgi:hypothetical protein
MSSPLVLGVLQFVVLLHCLIVLACFTASEPGEPLSQLPLAHTQSRSSCKRYVTDELAPNAVDQRCGAF